MGWQHGLKTTFLCTALGCGLAGADGVPNADADALTDAGMGADEGLTDAEQEPLPPTWAQCRHAFLASRLDPTQTEACEALHAAPRAHHRIGLHWIFLGHDEATVASYPETQMEDLNTIYAESNMEFFVHSRQRIVDPVATEGAYGETVVQLAALMPDIRQVLGTDESDPETLFDLLTSRLEEQGADLNARERRDPVFRLTAGWRARFLHAVFARLHPELITIVVRQAPGEKSTGTYPGRNIARPFSGMIYLGQTSALSALPHEIGHFFGLPHTHGTWDSLSGATQDWQLSSIEEVGEVDWAALQALAGEDYSSRFEQVYPAFDAPQETIDTLTAGQLMARKVLGWAELTYQGNFEPIANDGAFVAMVRQGQAPQMKNFMRIIERGDFSGNNCTKSYRGDDRRTLRCKYGDDEAHQQRTAEHPLVGGTLLFGAASDASNLMSYISTDISDGTRRKRHLTSRQRDLIRLGSRMPTRLRLRHHPQP